MTSANGGNFYHMMNSGMGNQHKGRWETCKACKAARKVSGYPGPKKKKA